MVGVVSVLPNGSGFAPTQSGKPRAARKIGTKTIGFRPNTRSSMSSISSRATTCPALQPFGKLLASTDTFLVPADLIDADQREAASGTREQP